MKKRIYLLSFLILSFLTYSCNTDRISNPSQSTDLDSKENSLVIRERPQKSFKLSKNISQPKKKLSPSISSGQLTNKEYLGRSYDPSSSGFGTASGVRFPVINIEDYLNDYPEYSLVNGLNASSAESFSFSSFDRYVEKSNRSNKVSAGFSLNLGLFSIGSKNKFQSSFSSEEINETKQVFGELNVIIKDTNYKLLTSTNSIDNIKREYLKSYFLDELYNNSNKEFVDIFGGFVLTDYITGGRANVLYSGKYTKTSSAQTMESSMDNSIEASFSFNDNGADADLGIGNSNASSVARQNNIESFHATAKTYGGQYGTGSFASPQSVDNINIDLSQWVSSFNNGGEIVLTSINDDGLRPITDFLLEDNFKHNIEKVLSPNIDEDIFQFQEPIIEAKWIFQAPGIVSLDVSLVTRFGDKLQISNRTHATAWHEIGPNGEWNTEAVKDHILNNFKEEMNAYGVKVMASNQIYQRYEVSTHGYQTSIEDISETNMQKYHDSNHGNTYLLSNQNGNKTAYSIHDDYILDTYGIRSWVENLPNVQISYNDLKDYEIIGL